jgi:hypothetical protein
MATAASKSIFFAAFQNEWQFSAQNERACKVDRIGQNLTSRRVAFLCEKDRSSKTSRKKTRFYSQDKQKLFPTV